MIFVDRPKHRFVDVASMCWLGVDKITRQVFSQHKSAIIHTKACWSALGKYLQLNTKLMVQYS